MSADAKGRVTALVLLCLLYALSYVDRSILSVLTEPVTRDLHVSDARMGLVIGMGFSIVYALAGVPIAHLLDAGNRVRLLCAGVAIWSLMTIASGFAGGFASLTACRAGVALGEAVLTPAAISLIADLFARERTTVPIALYSSVATVMGTGALAVGGAALEVATRLVAVFPIAPWRITLVLVGAPGLLLAGLFFLAIGEPPRRERTTAQADPSFGGFASFLTRRWRFYLPFYCAIGALATYFMGMTTWLPTALVRLHGLSPQRAGYLIGATGLPASLLAAILWPWLSTLFRRRHPRAGLMLTYLLALGIGAPLMIAAPLLPSLAATLASLSVVLCTSLVIAILPGLTIQHHGPYRFRARLMSLVLLAGGLAGYLLGSLAVPLLAGLWPSPAAGLAHGIALLGVVTVPIMLAGFGLAARYATMD